MLGDGTAGMLRCINALAGKHGEYVASFVLNRLPQRLVPTEGQRAVRRGGIQWKLDLNNKLQKRLYLVGSYESLTLKAISKHLEPTDIVLDVGANIGALSLPIARLLDGPGRVIAVEPANDTTARLRHHVAINRLGNRVQVVQAALSSRAGQAMLRSSRQWPTDTGSRTLEGDSETTGVPVRLVTGDALRAELRVDRFDIIKIDVEGHESPVLDGLAATFADRPPRVVVLEVLAVTQGVAGRSTKSIVAQMNGLGYDGFAIRHRGLVPYTPSFCGNVLFLRHDLVSPARRHEVAVVRPAQGSTPEEQVDPKPSTK